jgi:hypothetical protein
MAWDVFSRRKLLNRLVTGAAVATNLTEVKQAFAQSIQTVTVKPELRLAPAGPTLDGAILPRLVMAHDSRGRSKCRVSPGRTTVQVPALPADAHIDTTVVAAI